jgi:hypothetical protein
MSGCALNGAGDTVAMLRLASRQRFLYRDYIINSNQIIMDNSLEGKPRLPLHDLADRHRGLTPAVSDAYIEAARVCLDRHHVPPIDIIISNDGENVDTIAIWEPTDERQRAAWANELDATRDGAYAFALAATELCLGLCAVSRAETLTGADYYIGLRDQSTDDLESCFRLEVSGTDLDTYEVNRRLRRKVKQALKGKSNLPAIATVVGFRVKLITMQKVYDES